MSEPRMSQEWTHYKMRCRIREEPENMRAVMEYHGDYPESRWIQACEMNIVTFERILALEAPKEVEGK